MKTYSSDGDHEGLPPTHVGIAEYAVTDNGEELTTLGLGSCVAIALYDPEAGVSGLAHIMLPASTEIDEEQEAKFADTGIAAMIRDIEHLGGDRDRLEAKVVGGSEMFEFTGIAEGVGRRNVQAVKSELAAHGIPVTGEDVGGNYGRSVSFDATSGNLDLRTATGESIEL